MNDKKFLEMWESLKEEMEEKSFDKRQLSLSLEGSTILGFKNNFLILGAETKISEVILNKMHFQEIFKVLAEKIDPNIKLKIIYSGDFDIEESTKEFKKFLIPLSNSLIENYKFENFVISNKNKMIYKAALAISIIENSEWNPLFIHGKSGLGKTHILHAIGNSRKSNFPNNSIKYIEAKDFGQIVFDAFESKNVNKEIDKINKEFFGYDLLLIDDIQFIKSRKKTKEVFFNIFNYFIQNKKNIVVTSDQSPEELTDFEERFITRFKSGLSLKIEPPNYTTAKEILKLKIQSLKEFYIEDFDDEALNWISLNFNENVRYLEGALNKLLLYFINKTDEKIKRVTLEYVKEIFSDFKNNKKNMNEEKIINIISSKYSISKEEIMGKSRKKEIILARNICIYLIRELLDKSLIEIGKKFNKDHSTIINSLSKVKEIIKNNQNFERNINNIKNELTSY